MMAGNDTNASPPLQKPTAPTQLLLPVQVRAQFTFANFFGAENAELVARLRAIAAAVASTTERARIWIIGANGAGKSHLLNAIASAAQAPLLAPHAASPAQLRALIPTALIALEDIQRVAGDPDWEATLLQTCNEQTGGVVFASTRHPADAGFLLADLRSRLAACEIYRLSPVNEAELRTLLMTRAASLGLVLPEEVIDYLMVRLPRDAASQVAVFDVLDLASWRAQRRLTVPFVRSVLGADEC